MSRLATSVVAVCLYTITVSPARADTPTRPTVAVIPADQRIRQLSEGARAAIEEIDGKARGSRLLDLFSAARKRGELRRWALEVQSVVHPKNGDYLFKLYLVIRDIRKADPEATIVLTDFNNPEAPPLIYPPGTQPPPKGSLPANQAPIVSYPDP